jgi:serine/threonine protein kinase
MPRDAAPRNSFEIGSLVQGKYQIIEVIGKGGMGVVYKVRQVAVSKLMAVKRLLASREESINESALRRFQIEAKACFKLNHKNIVKVFDFDPNDGDPFLVMEFVEGVSLSSLIRSKVRLSIESTMEIALQLCDGLAHAHGHNILHRDLKPQNIMYQEIRSTELFGKEEPPHVKILDFGLAKIFDTADGTARTLTKTGEAFGTPLYMSPEQCQGKQLDEKSDIYSLGCVIYECLTGQPPL